MVRQLARRALTAATATTLTVGALAVAAGGPAPSAPLVPQQRDCPPGYNLVDAADLIAARELGLEFEADQVGGDISAMLQPICLAARLGETPGELLNARQAREVSLVAPGTMLPARAYEQAYADAAALVANADTVPGATGVWQQYGVGQQIGDDPDYPGATHGGYTNAAGRVDSFAYDPEAKRVFATGSSIGVWMSEDDGRSWVSIGDDVPAPAIGAITWTPAGGGTLAIITGEMVYGGSAYLGTGAYWSDDLGQNWHRADGVPSGALGFAIEADLANPGVIYAATGQGLFRSDDAGRTYVNVNLPTSPECAGVTGVGNPCDTANMVTDVIVKAPGGSTDEAGGEVLAVVAHRNDKKTYPTGEERSPGQGLYRSATGEPDTFERLDPLNTPIAGAVGFADYDRMGRTELGQATGPDQDHNIVYAIVADAIAMAGGVPALDLPGELDPTTGTVPLGNTYLDGLYVSTDFGDTWLQMADGEEIAYNPTTNSTFAASFALNAPGVQAWYNEYIEPDPTRTDPLTGAPTRLLFGLEEIWSGRTQSNVPFNGPPQLGPDDFHVVGRYWGDEVCIGPLTVSLPGNLCPTSSDPTGVDSTTHPDQHDLLYIPKDDGGVTVLAGTDGGVFRADLAPGQDLTNNDWQDSNEGMMTLLPYSVAVAYDDFVYYGNQDNGIGLVSPDEDYHYHEGSGGDGTGAYVDPFDGYSAFSSSQLGGLIVTGNGGRSWTSATSGGPGNDSMMFVTPLTGDEVNGGSIMTAGRKVWQSSFPGVNWVEVFDLNAGNPGEPGPTGPLPGGLGDPLATPGLNQATTMTVLGDAGYVGYCGVCDVYRADGDTFLSGLATNVGDDEYEVLKPTGWHLAQAEGLPERYITSIAIDEDDDATIWVTLGGYAGRRWAGIDTWTDPDRGTHDDDGHVYKSTDAGETFVDVSGDLPDIRFNRVIQRGDQLIAASDAGVFISSDLDGTTWAKMDGLPLHAPVTDLQLQPENDDRLFASVYGRSIWTYDFLPQEATAQPQPQVDEVDEVEPAPAPLPVTGGGMAVAGLAAAAAASWARRRRGPRWQR